MRQKNIQNYFIFPEYSIRKAIEVIDKTKDGIALVVDKKSRLLGTITDGDIRRFALANGSFDESCSKVMSKKPITAPIGTKNDTLCSFMNKHHLRNIPLVDEMGRPKRIVVLGELIRQDKSSLVAVIMAGGEGKRLRPITEKIPKPMIKVGEKPLLEKIITDLKKYGFKQIYISVNYQAEAIQDYFKDGLDYGVKIRYLRENKRLGTAGALSLLSDIPSKPILVMNGDLVTTINFDHFLQFHERHRCMMTVAAMEYNIKVPYGVLDLANHYVLGMDEKPSQRFLCNAGIYIIDPELFRFIPAETFYDMSNLLQDVVREGLPISAFPIHEYWLDIGQMEDLQKACEDLKIKLQD